MFVRLMIFLLVSLTAFSSWGTEYSRRDHICNNFERMKELYERRPESASLQIGYAFCLILKGEDASGMKMLYDLIERENNVKAAFLIAEYIETKGTFDFRDFDEHDLEEIINAYLRVLLYIHETPNYGQEYILYEEKSQMELISSFRVPFYYYNKFIIGFTGSENEKFLTSPSYKGERNLETFPDYNQHTINSLKSAVKFGSECANLPKKWYFKPDFYSDYTTACRIIRDLSKALIPLEEERMNLLHDESCAKDLPKCAKYYENRKNMGDLVIPAIKELRKTGV